MHTDTMSCKCNSITHRYHISHIPLSTLYIAHFSGHYFRPADGLWWHYRAMCSGSPLLQWRSQCGGEQENLTGDRSVHADTSRSAFRQVGWCIRVCLVGVLLLGACICLNAGSTSSSLVLPRWTLAIRGPPLLNC